MTDGLSREGFANAAQPVWPGQNSGLPYARCADYKIHPAHPFVTRLPYEDQCPGWTAEEDLARTLITSALGYLREHYPAGDQPSGLRLEMHPEVLRSLLHVTGYWGYIQANRFPVPVKPTTDLPRGSWRLVIVTEEVLLEGKAADDP